MVRSIAPGVAWAWPTKYVGLNKAKGWLEPSAIRSLVVPSPAGDGGFVEGDAATALVDDIQTTMGRLEAGLAATGNRDEIVMSRSGEGPPWDG